MPELPAVTYDMLTVTEQSEVQDFMQFLIAKRTSRAEKTGYEKKLDAIRAVCGLLTDEEAEEIRRNCRVAFGIEYQTEESLRIAAENYAVLRKNGTLIEDDDILIGSLAIAKNAVLVTNNTKHLSRLPGVVLETWA